MFRTTMAATHFWSNNSCKNMFVLQNKWCIRWHREYRRNSEPATAHLHVPLLPWPVLSSCSKEGHKLVDRSQKLYDSLWIKEHCLKTTLQSCQPTSFYPPWNKKRVLPKHHNYRIKDHWENETTVVEVSWLEPNHFWSRRIIITTEIINRERALGRKSVHIQCSIKLQAKPVQRIDLQQRKRR